MALNSGELESMSRHSFFYSLYTLKNDPELNVEAQVMLKIKGFKEWVENFLKLVTVKAVFKNSN